MTIGGHKPGSSRACDECRTRRKRCDLQQPQCLRCRHSGLRCSGAKPKAAVFINRQADAFHSQSHREALVDAYRGRKVSSSAWRSHEFYKATSGHIQELQGMFEQMYSMSSLVTNDTILSIDRAFVLPTYTALLDEFMPEREVGIFSGDRTSATLPKIYSSIAMCIRSLLPLASLRIAILDRCILTLLALYYGRLHGDVGLVEFARSSYTVALNQFSRQLDLSITDSNATEWNSVLLFMSIALQVFEHLDHVDVFGKGHLAHINGALQLLHTVGPKRLGQSQELWHAFCGIRGVAVFVAIEQRELTFLAEPEWLSLQFGKETKSARDRLHDLAVEIPALLKLTDDIVTRLRPSTRGAARLVDLGLHLINEIAGLRRRFEEWLYSTETAVDGPLFWSQSHPIVLVEQQRDTECRPKYTNSFHQLLFSNAPVAGLLAHFWSFQLQLLMTSIDLQHSLHLHSSTTMPGDADSRLTSQILSRGLFADRLAAEKIAQLILEAQPYLSSCWEGLLCLQPPLRILERYFEQYHNAQDES